MKMADRRKLLKQWDWRERDNRARNWNPNCSCVAGCGGGRGGWSTYEFPSARIDHIGMLLVEWWTGSTYLLWWGTFIIVRMDFIKLENWFAELCQTSVKLCQNNFEFVEHLTEFKEFQIDFWTLRPNFRTPELNFAFTANSSGFMEFVPETPCRIPANVSKMLSNSKYQISNSIALDSLWGWSITVFVWN